MSKRIEKISNEVAQRWKNTITAENSVDVAAARKLILARSKKAKIFEVETPQQFFVAQAIMRGRISKKRAKEICAALEIDDSFVSDMRRIGGLQRVLSGNSWYRRDSSNIVSNLLRSYTQKELEPNAELSARPLRINTDREVNNFRLCHLRTIYLLLIGNRWQFGSSIVGKEHFRNIAGELGFGTSVISSALTTRDDAVSSTPEDILNDAYAIGFHEFDATHAEIIARALNIKNPAINITYEIFHCVPAILHFSAGALLLTKTPKIHLNDDGELHNEEGPAVSWQGRDNFWYIDGHRLAQHGKKIVTAPKTMTINEVTEIVNEEEKRVAIDRYGWAEYLEQTGSEVIDYRENWVDNTVEVLIKPTDNSAKDAASSAAFWRPEQPLRMVLSCRSTGRKYFIGVPNRTSTLLNISEPDQAPANVSNEILGEPNCEMAQNWLADGGFCEHLPYAKYKCNIVGAS